MSPPSKAAVHLLISGRVQGVGFRYFAQEAADALELAGWVRNTPDGAVEAYGEGPKEALDAWIAKLGQGPPLSRVEALQPTWKTPEGSHPSFSIR